MLTNTMLRFGAIGLLAIGVGCADNAPPASDAGNAALGIAEFRYEDNATKTSVVGLDETGQVIARLDLVHGRFAPTDNFKEEYDAAEIDGRKLDVRINGQVRLAWQTAGYTPTLNMPAHPASEWELATFLADPHVKLVLDRWQIGFAAASALDGEEDYGSEFKRGAWQANCSGQTTCGSTSRGTINTCNASTAAIAARRVTTFGTYPHSEYFIQQCCPPTENVLGGTTKWFGAKACDLDNSHNSACGTVGSAACKACPTYPVRYNGSCTVTSVANGTMIDPIIQAVVTAYDVSSSWDAPYCGDGTCDSGIGETSSNCSADCGGGQCTNPSSCGGDEDCCSGSGCCGGQCYVGQSC